MTLDKDFGELALVHGAPHAGIVRLVNFSVRQQATVCLQVITLHGEELREGLSLLPNREDYASVLLTILPNNLKYHDKALPLFNGENPPC